jgi:hypothetical protein
MIGHQRPSKARRAVFSQNFFQARDPVAAVLVIEKDLAALDPLPITWCTAPGASMRA